MLTVSPNKNRLRIQQLLLTIALVVVAMIGCIGVATAFVANTPPTARGQQQQQQQLRQQPSSSSSLSSSSFALSMARRGKGGLRREGNSGGSSSSFSGMGSTKSSTNWLNTNKSVKELPTEDGEVRFVR